MSSLAEACVYHLKMNDNAASTVVVDSQGYSNGTAQQNTEDLTTTGIIGGALSFNGTSDYIDTNDSFESVFQSDFSISFWCKPDDGQPSIPKIFLGTRTFDYSDGIDFYILSAAQAGKVYFWYSTNGSAVDVTASSAVFDDGQETWHHIVCIVQQTTSTRIDLFAYFDMSLCDSSYISEELSNYVNSGNLLIGQVSSGGVVGSSLFFDGSFDNFMIFNRALTTKEIARLYNSGNGTEKLSSISGPPRRLLLRRI